MKPTCAVIPAAGKGTRLYPLTYAVPKELLPLGQCPTIQHVVLEIGAAGGKDIIVVTAKEKRAIQEHLDVLARNGETDAAFTYVTQQEQRGLGDAVYTAEAAVAGRACIVALGAAVRVGSAAGVLLGRLQRGVEENAAECVVAVREVAPADTVRYGIIAPGEISGDAIRVSDLVEKPEPAEAPSNMAICGRYIFSPAIFAHLAKQGPGTGGEIQLTDAMASLARSGKPVYACPLEERERRLDVGNLETYYRAVVEVAGPLLEG